MNEKLYVSYGRCEACGHIAEYYFNTEDNSTELCSGCLGSAEKISKVIVWKANA